MACKKGSTCSMERGAGRGRLRLFLGVPLLQSADYRIISNIKCKILRFYPFKKSALFTSEQPLAPSWTSGLPEASERLKKMSISYKIFSHNLNSTVRKGVQALRMIFDY